MKPLHRYQRLGRSAILSVAMPSSLWLGDDHLLFVRHQRLQDQYRRFYFKDIQWIRIFQNSRMVVQAGFLGMLAIAYFMAGVVSESLGFRIFWAIGAMAITAFFLLNIIYGHTCTFRIKTAVGAMRLPVPCRRRQAEAIMARVHPLIEQAQAGLAAQAQALEPVSDGGDRAPEVPEVSAAAALPPPLYRSQPPPLPHNARRLNQRVAPIQACAALLFVCFGLAAAALLNMPHIALVWVALIIAVLGTVVNITLLIIQRRHSLDRVASRFNKAVMAAFVAVAGLLYGLYYVLLFQEPALFMQQGLTIFLRLSTTDSAWIHGLVWGIAAVCCVPGIALLSSRVRNRGTKMEIIT